MHAFHLGGLEADYRVEAHADAVAEIPTLGVVAAGHSPYVEGAGDAFSNGLHAALEFDGDVGAIGEIVAATDAQYAEGGPILRPGS